MEILLHTFLKKLSMHPERQMFPTVHCGGIGVSSLLNRSHSPSSLMQQVSCCVATYSQIFLVLMPAKDVGEGREGFREGRRAWDIFVGKDLSQQNAQLWSISSIPEGFSWVSFKAKMVSVPRGPDEMKERSWQYTWEGQCWKVYILFSWWRYRDLAQVGLYLAE